LWLNAVNMKNSSFLSVLALTCLLSSCFSSQPAQDHQFRVIGYLPASRVDTGRIPFSYLTSINYAFGIPTPDGSGALMPIPRPDTLHALVTAAHAHGVEVFISVGGWSLGDGGGNDTRYEVLASTAASRTRFCASVMNVVRTFQLDGADIDWEYPDPVEPSSSNYVLLMGELKDSLHAAGKLLTTAVVSRGDRWGYGIKKEAFAIADWVNIMAYDDSYSGFNFKIAPHSPYWLALRAFDYWVDDRGLPAEKAVMGVPFYGRGPGRGGAYRQLLAQGADPQADVYDSIYYNGIKTMRQKTRLAMERGSGIMIWEISEDTTGTNSLLRAIHEELTSAQ
jgi:GH18 family chitinase